jgi:hypothetical protein
MMRDLCGSRAQESCEFDGPYTSLCYPCDIPPYALSSPVVSCVSTPLAQKWAIPLFNTRLRQGDIVNTTSKMGDVFNDNPATCNTVPYWLTSSDTGAEHRAKTSPKFFWEAYDWNDWNFEMPLKWNVSAQLRVLTAPRPPFCDAPAITVIMKSVSPANAPPPSCCSGISFGGKGVFCPDCVFGKFIPDQQCLCYDGSSCDTKCSVEGK